MKIKKRILIVATLALTSTVFAQGTINNQFTTLINKSGNYQTFKIVDKQSLLDLQQTVDDSLHQFKSSLAENKALVAQHKQELDEALKKLETSEQELKTSLAKEVHFEVFGVLTDKNTFQTTLIALLALLLILVATFYYRFKKCHVDTKEAIRKLQDTDDEFDEYRKSALEREQKIRRQLQDEINKNKVD